MPAISPVVLEEIQKKLKLGERQVRRRIDKKGQELLLPTDRAALVLANELGIKIDKYASEDDLKAIRDALRNVQLSSASIQQPKQQPPKKSRERATFPASSNSFVETSSYVEAARKNAE